MSNAKIVIHGGQGGCDVTAEVLFCGVVNTTDKVF